MKVQMNKRLKLTAFEERIHYCYTQSYILLDLYDIYVEFQYVKEDSPAIQFISDKLITPCLEVRILRSVKVKLQTSINDTYLENKDLKLIVPQPDINKPDYYNLFDTEKNWADFYIMDTNVKNVLMKPKGTNIYDYNYGWGKTAKKQSHDKKKGLWMMVCNKLDSGVVIYKLARYNPVFYKHLILFAFMNSTYSRPQPLFDEKGHVTEYLMKKGSNNLWLIVDDLLDKDISDSEYFGSPKQYLDDITYTWANTYLDVVLPKVKYIHSFIDNIKSIRLGRPIISNSKQTAFLLKGLYDKNNFSVLNHLYMHTKHQEKQFNMNILDRAYKEIEYSHVERFNKDNYLSKITIITQEPQLIMDKFRDEWDIKFTKVIKGQENWLDPLMTDISTLDDEFRHSLYCNYRAFYYKPKHSSEEQDRFYLPPSTWTPVNFSHNIGYVDYFAKNKSN